MDPRIASQRRGAVLLLIAFAVVFGVVTGFILASGLDWLPHSIATTVDQPAQMEPGEFLVETQENFRDIVASVRPAVVSIQAEGTMTLPQGYGEDPFEWFFREWGWQIPERDRREYQEREIPQVSAGSGFLVDADGHILTNNHVVGDADEITVILDDGRRFDAQVLVSDPDTDVAVLKIDSDEPLPYVPMGDSDQLQVGDWVVAIGNPFGYLAGTVTVGIVSATNREHIALPVETYYQNFIQTDAAINLGNSGGPLVDIYGRAVGINTAITAYGSGIGFAIPINMADFVYESFLEHGEVIRGWIGVTIQNVDPDLAEAYGMDDTNGALVAEVHPGDPADRAGLQEEDIILEIDGHQVISVQSASRLIASLPVGEPAEFVILRDGEEMSVMVTPEVRDLEGFLARQTEEEREEPERPRRTPKNEKYLGIEVEEITSSIIRNYDLPEDTAGVIVTDVNPDGPAYEKGMREGSVILSINHEPVETLDDYDELMQQAHDRWLADESTVVIRYLVYNASMGSWVRQFMAVPFE